MFDTNKMNVQAALYQRLKAEDVPCDLNVACNELRLDVALQTGEYIYGCINVTDGKPSPVIRNSIEVVNCSSIEEVEECVTWAKLLNAKHKGSQPAIMLA